MLLSKLLLLFVGIVHVHDDDNIYDDIYNNLYDDNIYDNIYDDDVYGAIQHIRRRIWRHTAPNNVFIHSLLISVETPCVLFGVLVGAHVNRCFAQSTC